MNLHILTLTAAAVILLLIALEDLKAMSIERWRSFVYEGILICCILINFLLNWQLSLLLLVVGVMFYFIGIPTVKRLMKEKNYYFAPMDKELFIITMMGFPFISLFAFIGNQVWEIARIELNRLRHRVSVLGPKLVVYGGIWFALSLVVIAFYLR